MPLVRVISSVALVAILLSLPALLNGYPILFPDTLDYMQGGRSLRLSLEAWANLGNFSVRSVAYSVFVYLLYWDWSLWPVIVAQAMITAWMLYLTTRVVLGGERIIRHYLILGTVLAIASPASWYSSFLMPDIFAGILLMCVFLLAFGRDRLGWCELAGVTVTLMAAASFHASHWLLALMLAALLAIGAAMRPSMIPQPVRAVLLVAVPIVGTMVAVFSTSYLLGGSFAPAIHPPPFLLARVIADGPGDAWLKQNCGDGRYALCSHAGNLPTDADFFLWNGEGPIWSSPAWVRQRILDEQDEIVWGAVTSYPLWQIGESLKNFAEQLVDLSLYEMRNLPTLHRKMPGHFDLEYGKYLSTWQMAGMPLWFFTGLHYAVTTLAIILSVAALPGLVRWQEWRMVQFLLVAFAGLLGNALVTGVISGPHGRYQGRIAWLLLFSAGLCVLLLSKRHHVAQSCARATHEAIEVPE
jgi:hypothetical protein